MQWHAKYPEDITMFVSMVRKFCVERVRPVWRKFEDSAQFPTDIVREIANLGLFGVSIPEQYGGVDDGRHTTLIASLVARELAYEWPSLHLIWSANCSLAAFPILLAGTEEQKRSYLPRLATGEILGCYALTEPDAGSDVASMQMRASQEGEKWKLNGNKIFITNASRASLAVVFAKTGNSPHDISTFLLESKKPGLKIPGLKVKRIEKRILRSAPFCTMYFGDVVVPASSLLGEIGKGFKIAMATLDGGRINIAAQAVGIAARVFDEALNYVKQRKQFGRSVWENQAVQFDFVDWLVKIRSSWALVEQTSLLCDAGLPITEMASCAKLVATEMAAEVCSKAAMYFGGNLATSEFPWGGRVADALITPIYEGASNIQRIVIARELSKK